MKTTIKKLPLYLGFALLASTPSLWAAGTAAGTNIQNTASISYSVNSTAQTAITSNTESFLVDKKVDLLVTAGSGVNVTPGTSAQNITFTLLNEGNSSGEFSFSVTQVLAAAATDDFDTSNCTTPANVTLAADVSQIITVSCDIPASSATVINGATSQVDLKATAVGVTATVGADTAGTEDTVFADDTGTGTDGANSNAQHSAVNTYTVATADLSVVKSSTVTSDPVNGGTDPKRIPGATVEYSIVVSNAAGASTATGIVVSDTVPSTLTISSASIVVNGGASTAITPSGQDVTSAAFDLAASESATLTIVTTVN